MEIEVALAVTCNGIHGSEASTPDTCDTQLGVVNFIINIVIIIIISSSSISSSSSSISSSMTIITIMRIRKIIITMIFIIAIIVHRHHHHHHPHLTTLRLSEGILRDASACEPAAV